MKTKVGSKYIEIPNLKKCSPLGKFRGLMFRAREKSPALSFEFSKPTNMKIHSYFVFFPFLAIWLDNNGRILKKKLVKPFIPSVGINPRFSKLIEIPINNKYSSVINQLSKAPRE